MREAVWKLLQSGGTLLCANAHAARTWTDAHDQQKMEAGVTAWPRARIFALGEWLRAQTPTPVLSSAQERWLWNDIIRRLTPGHDPDVGGLSPAAPLAMSAWKLAQEWNLPLEGSEWQESEGTALFGAWAREVRPWCRNHGWITAAQLPLAASNGWLAGPETVPARAGLLGFDRLTPQQQDLLGVLRQCGATVETIEPLGDPAPLELCTPPDANCELRWAARWALERRGQGVVGMVVPDLATRRALVEAVLQEAAQGEGEDGPRAFHLSLGAPLSRHPIVNAALRLLDWQLERQPRAEKAYALLRSPFFGAAETDRDRRARREVEWRRQGWEFLPPGILAGAGLPLPRPDWRQSRRYTDWALAFSDTLDAAGWPGERSLSSQELQSLGAWQRLCADLARLDQVAPTTVTAETALAWLRLIAGQRPFQPEAQGSAVQVMGWLEAAGLEFDHLWVCGLHDGVLPAAPAPHPLLPMVWQREREMPRATAALEAAFASRVLDRVRRSCTHLVVSCPQSEGDTRLRRSPLLASAQPTDPPRPTPEPSPAALEQFLDDTGPALTGDDPIAGGSDVVRAQSVCGFQAFARHRLGARRLDPIPAGLPAGVRGRLLHRVLEEAWKILRDQAGLQGMGPAQRTTLLRQLAASAVGGERLFQGRPQLARLEINRLVTQVNRWFNVESQRPPFRVRERELERAREARLGGLRLQLRPDRIDDLADGSWLLIDYKSGEHSPADWHPPRPWEPQLPLYLVTAEDGQECAGVAFAQLKPGDMRLRGLTRSPNLLGKSRTPGWATDWEEVRVRWLEDLTALAEAFRRGAAAVMPKSPQACPPCGLQSLCRIAPRVPDQDDENLEGGNAD